jgi:glutamate racemase
MLSNPIGIFDSGIGGLSVLKAIREILPNENIIYVADQAYAPYGKKSKTKISERAKAISSWLVVQQCKLIVVACNTVTTNSISKLRRDFSIPFVGIEPAIKPAALGSKTGVIGVLATEGTLTSELFHLTSSDHTHGLRVVNQIGHGLVELVENGKMNSEEAEEQLSKIVKKMLNQPIDHLVLGCTHYPFLSKSLKKILPKHINIIDCSNAVARQTHRILDTHALHQKGNGKTKYFSTGAIKKIIWESFGVDNVQPLPVNLQTKGMRIFE